MPASDAVDFDPPAPVARARLASSTRTAADVPMLLDTGADVSVVPRSIAEQIDAASRPSGIRLEMYDGAQVEVDVADLTLEFGTYRFRGAFVVADAEHGVLGRNILNLLVLTLDGPSLLWTG